MTLKKPTINIVLACGGTIETSIIPYHAIRLLLLHPYLNIRCVLTPDAEHFVTKTALKGITGNQVYTEGELFSEKCKLPIHIDYSIADLFVFYPSSARLIAQMATGIISCPVTRIFSFAEKEKMIITPFLHPGMPIKLYQPHFLTLKKLGCELILPKSDPYWDTESAWVATGKAIRKRIGEEEDLETRTTLDLSQIHQKQ